MDRGFSLIELLITVAVMVILMLAAAPSMGNLNEKAKVQRLAEELSGFLIQARSEAVMLNKPLYLIFLPMGSSATSPILSGQWGLALRDTDTIPSFNALSLGAEMYLPGNEFKNISIFTDSQWQPLTLDGVNGRPVLLSASSSPATIHFSVDSEKQINISLEQFSGRVKICGEDGEYYGYPKCN